MSNQQKLLVQQDIDQAYIQPVHQLTEDEILKKKVEHEQELKDKAVTTLYLLSLISLIFMIVELIGGYIANSIAIMTDAMHQLCDVSGFLISIFGLKLSNRKATKKLTFGFHRAEVLGALGSIIVIWGITLYLVYVAVLRMFHKTYVDGTLMSIMGGLSLMLNIVRFFAIWKTNYSARAEPLAGVKATDFELHEVSEDLELQSSQNQQHIQVSERKDLNVRAAFIHILGDTVETIGIVVAAILIMIFGQSLYYGDPICSIVFAVLVILTTVQISADCTQILMEGAPSDVNQDQIQQDLEAIDGVQSAHDLHIWQLSQEKVALSCHLVTQRSHNILCEAAQVCKKHNITHYTIQVESIKDFKYNSTQCMAQVQTQH